MIVATAPIERLAAPLVLAGVFVVLLLAERSLPLRRATHSLRPRVWTNVAISILGFAVGALVVRPVAMHLTGWSAARGFGLLIGLQLPGWARLAVGFVLMDLTFYYWHRANHRLGALWRFHRVHHVDPDMDVTTSFRFHPGEVLYSTAFRAAQVTLLGVSWSTYLVYEAAFHAFTMFHHSNVRLPISVERGLNRIFVTPRMHGVHHSVKPAEVNSNYSVVFRWWDRLHRSLILNVPQRELTLGVAGRRSDRDNTIQSLLLSPFRGRGRPARAADHGPVRRSESFAGPPGVLAE